MFDLPVGTAKERSVARKFVKFLKDNGFVMFQESIYVKLCINETSAKSTEKIIKTHLPPQGLVSSLTLTETQFNSITYMLGDFQTDVITTDDRVIEL